ncbi:MAG TPA: hypothetical protein DDZ51_10845 [Planctomycetaceae bacterium]|nr:hypothetical protein [Planctomycetaceae bacterium]
MRELRQKVGAKARVSRELAGLDVKRAEADFMEFAKNSEANNEFDALIGLAGEAAKVEAPRTDAKLPE